MADSNQPVYSGISRKTFIAGVGGASAAVVLGPLGSVAQARPASVASSQPGPWVSWVKSFHPKPVKIGFSIWEASNPFYTPTRIGVSDAGAQLGITTRWIGPAAPDVATQVSQFKDLVRAGFEGICVVPISPAPWDTPINEAVDQGVVVVTANLDAPASKREVYFAAGGYASGYIQGQVIGKLVGKRGGKVASTNCAPGNAGMAQLGQGLKKALQEAGLTLVGPYPIDATDPAKNLATVEDIVRANPDLVALAPGCGPDTVSAGDVKQRTNGKFVVVGHDLLSDTLAMIKSGVIDATTGQKPYLQGYLPIMYLYQRTVLGMDKPTLPQNWWNVGLEVVTKQNVDAIIAREKRFA